MADKRRERPVQKNPEPGRDQRASLAKIAVVAVLAVGVGVIVSQWLGAFRSADKATAIVEPASYTALAAQGRGYFDENCSACHGKLGAGSEQGPPLIHPIYRPGHHPDEAFMRAPRTGVRAHHWKFGDMPPVPDVTDAQLRAVVAYVREIQRANGITF